MLGASSAQIHTATSDIAPKIASDVSSPPSAIDTATGDTAHSAAAVTATTRPAKR